MKHTESQRERLKAYLDSGRSINPLQAFNEIGTMKLATRISELIESGYPIKKEWVTVKNRFGEEVKVMKYRKDEPCPKCGGKGWYFVNEWFFFLQGRKDCTCTK